MKNGIFIRKFESKSKRKEVTILKTNKFISKFTIFLIIFSILFTIIPVNKVEAKVTGHDTNVLLHGNFDKINKPFYISNITL